MKRLSCLLVCLLAAAMCFASVRSDGKVCILVVGEHCLEPEVGRHLLAISSEAGLDLDYTVVAGLPEASKAMRSGRFTDIVLESGFASDWKSLSILSRGARVFLHQDWAYAVDFFKEPCVDPAFAAYGYDQKRMYTVLMDSSREICARYGFEILPVGTAVQNVRATWDRDNITRDGVHLNYSIGCYLAACTWFGAISGRDPRMVSYYPERLGEGRSNLSRAAARAALKEPYAVSDFGYRKLATNYDESAVREYILPDPLVMSDGRKVENAGQWYSERRPELLSLFESEMYGRMPGRLDGQHFELVSQDSLALGGTAIRREVRIYFDASDDHYMTVLLYLPRQVQTPVPVIVGANFRGNSSVIFDTGVSLPDSSQIRRYALYREPFRGQDALNWPVSMMLARGYGFATFFKGDLDPEWDDSFTNGVHPLFYREGQSYPDPDQWGAIGAWAWGYSRVLDYLEQVPEADAGKVVAAGHSRLAKTALWAAVQDGRFAMAFTNNSGCCGAAISRRAYGETLSTIIRHYHYWFCGNFAKYADREDSLPFDQHELLALMAPRPVYVTSGSEDRWSDPKGEFQGAKEASKVYEFLGVPGLYGYDGSPAGHETQPVLWKPMQGGNLGYHLRGGPHALTGWDWSCFLDFADKYLK